jgi:hypothetical protein
MTRTLGWRRLLYRRGNVTRGRSHRDELDRKTIELIAEHNALDLELYGHAQGIFRDELQKQGDSFRIEVEALERAHARVADYPDRIPLRALPATIDGASDGSLKRLDLRACLIETQTELLIRDWELERLGGIAGHRALARLALRGGAASPAA